MTVSAGGTGSSGGVVNTSSGSSATGSGGTSCANTYAPVTNGAFLTELEKGTPHNGAPGGWYLSTSCDGQYQGPVWLGAGGAGQGAPAVDPAVLAQEAKRRLPVPTPTITMTPPPDKVLVNDKTFLSIDPSQWGQRTASASAAGVTSTVVGVPEKVVWSMGDGQQVVCTGPGTPYNPAIDFDAQTPDCGYVYKRSSAGYPNDALTVTATLYYHATWSAAGAPGGGDLGLISATSAPVSVRVNEIHVVIIPGGRP
ncbi:MAG: hypothetical protein M3256_02890 [Actinomycetota bacterium]|nr:hypothetical protein [Actinomycetota bacterium]